MQFFESFIQDNKKNQSKNKMNRFNLINDDKIEKLCHQYWILNLDYYVQFELQKKKKIE